jgi:hypothetical protein
VVCFLWKTRVFGSFQFFQDTCNVREAKDLRLEVKLSNILNHLLIESIGHFQRSGA